MPIRTKIIKALKKRYKATVAENLATIEIFLENPAGIGDHPGILNDIDGLIEAAANAQEKLDFLQKKFGLSDEDE
tara:strand:- start:435 stop:659 length:225 start_codon:yes stop_codon:yes gene_type:complete